MTPLEQAAEVIRCCRRLAKYSETAMGTTRTCLSPPMRQVHTELAQWMSRIGMSVRVDAIGNLRGVRGTGAARLMIGSHLDSVPDAGAFDGVLGVVLGIALVELVAARSFDFSIEVIGFSDEEGVRFGVPFLGSRAVAGTFDQPFLDLRDARGRSLAQAVREFGLDPTRIPDAKMRPGVIGYLECHIEQGPVLDARGVPLAVVDAIAGQTRAEISYTGVAAHAGTTPMPLRKDALAAAAELIAEVERQGRSAPGLVATVGKIHVEPGAGNVIPGTCTLSVDVRHPDDSIRIAAAEQVAKAAASIAGRRFVGLGWKQELDQPAVRMAPRLTEMLQRSGEKTGLLLERMVSGAGHDAMVLAPHVPAAMLFVRCADGISHNPAESVREEDVAAALSVGMKFLDDVQRELPTLHAG